MIFGTPAIVAGAAGSEAMAILAWVIGGLISIIGAMCYAELCTAYPSAGGDYHFLKRAFGRDFSFIYGWSRATIINTGSIAGILARPTIHAYVAAKAGLHGLTRSMAAELGRSGITVNAIAPGYISTNNTAALQSDETRNRQILERIPSGRWGKPEDIAGAAVFLAAPASDYVTGQILAVDGGWLAR